MRLSFLFVLLGVGLLGCEIIDTQPPPTAIFVTATPQQQVIIVTNTPTPTQTPVLAPTLPGLPSDSSQLPSPAPSTTSPPQRTFTPTFTPTPTDTPGTPGAFVGPVGGVFATGGAAALCATVPGGQFADLYQNNPELAAQLGCPVGNPLAVSNAYQSYERGIMVWVSSVGESGQQGIYAIYNDGAYQRFNDTWQEGADPVSVGLEPPPGLVEPIRGFGKVWRENAGVSDALGWGTSAESGGSATIQAFERGEILLLPQTRQAYLLIAGQPSLWFSFGQ